MDVTMLGWQMSLQKRMTWPLVSTSLFKPARNACIADPYSGLVVALIQ